MRKTIIWGGLALLAVLTVSTDIHASETLERARERGHMIAAAVPDALPQSGRDEDGNLTGFDIEAAAALGEQLGFNIEFVTPTWQQILDGNWGGAWDFAVASMTPTPEREKTLSFPAVYRLSPAVLVVHAGNKTINAPADAAEKVIGVKQDTTYQQYLGRNLVLDQGGRTFEYLIDSPVVRTFPDKEAAMAALGEGDCAVVDAVVTSHAHAQAVIAQELPVRMVQGFLFFEPMAVAVDKSDPAFAQEVAAAVDALRQDGTLGRLSTEWFGIDLTQ